MRPSAESSAAAGSPSPDGALPKVPFAFASRWWRAFDDERAGWRGNLVAFLILIVISFVVLWLGDKLSSQGMALTRYMATTQAPVTGRFYPEISRDRITVITYDDAFLSENGSAWPLPYRDHADWLLRLATHPEGKPKAVFMDITFSQTREEASLPELQSALCEIQNEHHIPVFLAALVSPQDGALHVRPDLESTRDGQGRPCFTLVGVAHTQDPIDRQTWSYPLTMHLAKGDWVAGPATEPTAPSYRSAAMALAQDAAGIDLGTEVEPLALVWGSTTPVQHEALPEYLAGCRAGTRGAMPSVPRVLRQLWDSDPKPPICPFHTTFSMAQIGQMEDAALAPYLTDRYLMVGAAIGGQNDLAHSPVHGLVPGVHVHAMALDNLLTYGNQYKQHGEWRFPPSFPMFISGLVAIAAVFAVHLLFRNIRGGLRRNQWLQTRLPIVFMTAAERDRAPLRVRLLTVPIRLTLWLLRLTLQATAAVFLIAFMQWHFRIGMLPVVELVGMTILAEGLNYMDKVRVFLFGSGSPPEVSNDESDKKIIQSGVTAEIAPSVSNPSR